MVKKGDHVDVFLSPTFRAATVVHIIDQTDPKTGKFDEHKCMIGWDTQEEAKKAYLSNYEPGWKGFGDITTMSMPAFVKWVKDETKTTKQVSPIVKGAGIYPGIGRAARIATIINKYTGSRPTTVMRATESPRSVPLVR